MRSGVQAQVPVLNVGDADAAGRFYALFGYTGQRGEDGRSCLRCGDLTLLIVEGTPAPATLYLHVDDVAATTARLVAAGHPVENAPGGECRTADPDATRSCSPAHRACPPRRPSRTGDPCRCAGPPRSPPGATALPATARSADHEASPAPSRPRSSSPTRGVTRRGVA
nr:hypothetical protein [Micromonospora provocatoris]